MPHAAVVHFSIWNLPSFSRSTNCYISKQPTVPKTTVPVMPSNENEASLAQTLAEDQASFRKRRLSLHGVKAEEGNENDDRHAKKTREDNDHVSRPTGKKDGKKDGKAQTFRKRRLSLSRTRPALLHLDDETSDFDDDENVEDQANLMQSPRARPRFYSDASLFSVSSFATAPSTPLIPKTMHSEELLPNDQPPPSPAIRSEIYTQESLPPTKLPIILSPGLAESDGSSPGLPKKSTSLEPSWKTRQTVMEGDEHKLPFPRDIVGTYSCHGVEPIHDDEGDDNDEEDSAVAKDSEVEAESSTGWELTTGGGKPMALAARNSETRATMVSKINQDRGGIAYPYIRTPRTALFAVYDGHGQGGELVSQFALHEIQHRLERHEALGKDTPRALRETFLAVDEALKQEPMIESLFSGTTACVALLSKGKLTLANVGDSRAILAQKKADSEHHGMPWTVINLTVDQNPDLPEEMKRITSRGGFVSPPPGPGLSARVWLDAAYTQIGLAMARSIGDHAVAQVGVIAEPAVTHHEIGPNDDFMVLASDGVWEFMSSEDAARIVGSNLHRGATKACQALIEASAARWHEEEGEYRDDITAIVVRLQELFLKKRKDPTDST